MPTRYALQRQQRTALTPQSYIAELKAETHLLLNDQLHLYGEFQCIGIVFLFQEDKGQCCQKLEPTRPSQQFAELPLAMP